MSYLFITQVDEPTCSTPRRRQISIPSSQSIEGLVTPLDDLVRSFWDSRTPSKLVTGNVKRLDLAIETERVPLTTIN
jgi:kinesin family protein 11